MKSVRSGLSTAAVLAMVSGSIAIGSNGAAPAAASTTSHGAINSAASSAMCTEVANSDDVFGHYVGHDEPSVLFESNTPGSGNHMRYNITLPTDPSANQPNAVNKSYAFELSGAEWLGMAMCDTQSYPEQVSTCPPDSDKNILDPAISPKHVGEAYMEMQFYPPGWIPWPTWQVAVGASSCDPTRWCAALNIDSLSLDPVTGETNNPSCLSQVGEEYVNFAFITKSGVAQGPANPIDATTVGTYTPSAKDLFMNSGDHLQVSFGDTSNGLKVNINDLSSGQTGSMTAERGQRIRPGEVRSQRLLVYRYPVQLPPHVQHVIAEYEGDVGRRLVQRRVRHRDRTLPVLHRAIPDSGHPVRPGFQGQPYGVPHGRHRRQRSHRVSQ